MLGYPTVARNIVLLVFDSVSVSTVYIGPETETDWR